MFLSSVMIFLAACKPQLPVENTVVKSELPDPNPIKREEAVAELLANFARVHFETDSSQLDAGGKEALSANAVILQHYPDIKVEVQGHADERGTIDYNLSLGQRRANTVVGYLSSLGVASYRLPVVSYGEERPIESKSSEVAWAANRRAEFRVLSAPESVRGTIQ